MPELKILTNLMSLDNYLYDIKNTQISTNNYVYENLKVLENKFISTRMLCKKMLQNYTKRMLSNIGSKHLGKKHVYEGDVCLYTGEKKSDITQKL